MGNAADQIDSETTKTGQRQVSNYFDPPQRKPDDPAILKGTLELSEEYTTTDFISDSKARFEAESWSENFVQRTSGPLNTVAYQFHNQCGSSNYGVQKVQLKIVWGSMVQEEDRYTGNYVILFTPVDDPTTTEDESENLEIVGDPITFNTTTESDVYTIDPLKLNNDKLGSYSLIHVDLAVDMDRNEQLTFGAEDKTTSEEPYEFWVNNDRDLHNTYIALDQDPSSGTKDYENNSIANRRDLEDFSRIDLDVSSLEESLKAGNLVLGLRFKEVTDTPAIKLWENLSPDGGNEYLTGETVAEQHKGLSNPGHITSGDAYKIPTEYWNSGTSFIDGVAHFLFEGAGIGKGKLVVELYNGDTLLGEGGELWLELKDIKDIYARYETTLTSGQSISTMNYTAINALPHTEITNGFNQVGSFSYPAIEDNTPDEEKDYIVFVHGWRMKGYEKDYFAETGFKRLYWQGYKGRYASYVWPTEWADRDDPVFSNDGIFWDQENYTKSDQKAMHSGASLRTLLQDLNSKYTGRVRLYAHSMGNVVASEALKQHGASGGGQLVQSYIACQSASVASAYEAVKYNESSEYIDVPEPITDELLDAQKDETLRAAGIVATIRTDHPDVYGEYPPTGNPYYAPMNSAAANIVNFHNREDDALSWWYVTQIKKPNNDYEYDGGTNWRFTGSSPEIPLDFTNHPYFILARAAEAKSTPLGASVNGSVNTAGPIDGNTNLGQGGSLGDEQQFTDEPEDHSAQFLGTNMIRFQYWERLLLDFGIATNP